MTSPTAPRRALLVANPGSRRGSAALQPVEAAFAAAGVTLLPVESSPRETLTARLVAQAGEADLILAVGGDGTVNSVAAAAYRTGLPVGLIPAGTANDLARTLGLPLDPAVAAQVILAGRQTPIDLGEVNGTFFFNVASLGLSVKLADKLSSTSKKRWGRLGYLWALLRALAEARPFSAAITGEDGHTIVVKTLQIAVGNGRHYGGGMVVEQGAEINDGQLDLYSLEFKAVWKLLTIAGSFPTGRHGLSPEVRTLRGRQFKIATRRPRPINMDGELLGATPAIFTVHPAALRMIVP
ncbi:lipid kinase [Elstera cyanobacteriorum]|uniref:lipid kinase n=1 Tax=Elstera cyanobacteriorum TaxID=2022747 RepID=UPI0023565026|nr:lipid kinase [Elstera cyanobacteriorum]MCK6441180.1 lipid kinase [Elstera cyanobacteriorum]